MRNIYARNILKGTPCLPAKTPLLLTLRMTLYENIKPVEVSSYSGCGIMAKNVPDYM